MDEKTSEKNIEKLVEKRLMNFDYIKRLHQGDVFWMNTVHISKEDIINFYAKPMDGTKTLRGIPPGAQASTNPMKRKIDQWFYIGISLAPLLQLESGEPYIGALNTFWSEFEHWIGRKKTGGTKEFIAVNTTIRASRTGTGSSGNEFLNTPNIPSTLDYFEVVYSLCDLMEHIYKKFLAASLNGQQAKNVFKLDARIKTHLLEGLSKDMHKLAMSLVKQELNSFDKNVTAHGWEENPTIID